MHSERGRPNGEWLRSRQASHLKWTEPPELEIGAQGRFERSVMCYPKHWAIKVERPPKRYALIVIPLRGKQEQRAAARGIQDRHRGDAGKLHDEFAVDVHTESGETFGTKSREGGGA